MKLSKLINAAIILLFASSADAALVASANIGTNGPEIGFDYSYEVHIGFDSDSWYFSEGEVLFYSSKDEAGINGEGIKSRYILNSGSTFDNAVTLLTNGQNNYFVVDEVEWDGNNGSGGSGGYSEYYLFGFTDSDLSGVTISSIELVIGQSNATIEIHAVPVPPAFLFFGSAIISLIHVKRKHL